jgi:predicted Zn-dependent peptidase
VGGASRRVLASARAAPPPDDVRTRQPAPRERAATKGPVRLGSSPSPSYAVERFRLDNGLRVVLSPDSSSPVVAVAVYYDVGMRSEPQGRTGFAHLFEHMMFQGSANLGKTEHFTHVQGNGGTLNGSTHVDYTNYYEVMPSAATELALFLEADRMRSVAVTQENLDNQIAVVQNEIRVNVLNRPYGGFPWLMIPPLLFDDFANSHNGYGDFVDLESSTLEDAQAFFDRYYAPGNAVLTVAGDIDVEQVTAWVEQHFGDIPARPVPERPSFAEPAPTSEQRATQHDHLAPTPAVAMAWRVPDPADLETYLPYVVLAEVLTDGDASRCSTGCCSRTAARRTSAATSACSATRSTPATPRRSCSRCTTRSRRASTRSSRPSTTSWRGSRPTASSCPSSTARSPA